MTSAFWGDLAADMRDPEYRLHHLAAVAAEFGIDLEEEDVD